MRRCSARPQIDAKLQGAHLSTERVSVAIKRGWDKGVLALSKQSEITRARNEVLWRLLEEAGVPVGEVYLTAGFQAAFSRPAALQIES